MSSHVWNPRFVYRNHIGAAGSVTASDEVAGMEDDFLKSHQPQEVWRADTLSSLSVTTSISAAGSVLWDTVWLGYTNATPKRNVLVNSNAYDTTWATENSLPTENGGLLIAPGISSSWRITASSAGVIAHGIRQTWTPTLTMQANQTFSVTSYFNDDNAGSPPDGVQLSMVSSTGDESAVQLDFGTGTLGNVSESSGWSGGTATLDTVTTNGVDAYRVTLTSTHGTAVTTMQHRVRMVMSGSVTFEQAGEDLYLANGFLSVGNNTTEELPTTSERAAGLRLLVGATTVQDYWPMVARDMTNRKTDRGWVHGVAYSSATVRSDPGWTLQISDEQNADDYFQAGRLVIGKAWRPQAALAAGSSQSNAGYMARVTRNFDAGRATYDIDLDFLTEDSVRELWDMYVYCNPKGASGSPVEAEGGQLYRPGARPVLFLADDAAGAYEPERVIYGYLSRKPIISERNGLFRASVEIEELVP